MVMMMMDVAPLRAAIAHARGGVVGLEVDQLEAVLLEIERGHAAERDLANVRKIVNFTPKRWAVAR